MKVHNLSNLPTTDFHNFVPLQGDFKIQDELKLEKLKNRIKEVGFKYVFQCWQGDELYIIDAHQIVTNFNSLKENYMRNSKQIITLNGFSATTIQLNFIPFSLNSTSILTVHSYR